MIGYCMKCRGEVEMHQTKTVTMKNGRPATEGKCPSCGTRMYRLGKERQKQAFCNKGPEGPLLL